MRPQPIRYSLSNDYVAAARDMGDPAIVESAIRFWWSVRYPRTRPCSDADRALYLDWANQ